MALETGIQFINSLDAANPLAIDPLSQADEHIRNIKSSIKTTFPNVTGEVTATQADLNTKPAIISDGSTPSLASGIEVAEVKTLLGITDIITSDGSTLSLAAGINATDIVVLLGASLYPVGCVYTSVVVTSPATFFGGTWVAFGAGKVLVGVDIFDTSFDTVEEAGGAKTHTLTEAQLPAHTHGFTAMQDTNNSVNRTGGGDLGAPASSTTASTGGGEAFDIMQPYVTVYMWKRTA
jgi:hypothetical protein